MKTLTPLISTVAALAVLAAFGYGVYLGLQQLALLYAGLEAQVASVTVMAAAALLLAACLVASAVRRVGRDRLAVPLREEKSATYRLFVDCWQQRLLLGTPAASVAEALASLDRLLALCGSAAVIDAHTRLRGLAEADAADREAWWPVLAEALQQIRKELGAEPLSGAALQAVLATHAVAAPAQAQAAAPALVM